MFLVNGSSGPGGIFCLALSAVDIACWDLKGKAAGKSVCALLGDLRDRVPTYFPRRRLLTEQFPDWADLPPNSLLTAVWLTSIQTWRIPAMK